MSYLAYNRVDVFFGKGLEVRGCRDLMFPYLAAVASCFLRCSLFSDRFQTLDQCCVLLSTLVANIIDFTSIILLRYSIALVFLRYFVYENLHSTEGLSAVKATLGDNLSISSSVEYCLDYIDNFALSKSLVGKRHA